MKWRAVLCPSKTSCSEIVLLYHPGYLINLTLPLRLKQAPHRRQPNKHRLIRPYRPAPLPRQHINPVIKQLPRLGPLLQHGAQLPTVPRRVLHALGPAEHHEQVLKVGNLAGGERARDGAAPLRGADADVVAVLVGGLGEDGGEGGGAAEGEAPVVAALGARGGRVDGGRVRGRLGGVVEG